jgi:hypothetical protein
MSTVGRARAARRQIGVRRVVGPAAFPGIVRRDTVICDGWAKRGSRREGVSSRRRKREVTAQTVLPYTPLAFSLCDGFSHTVSSQLRARALPVGLVARARSCPVPLRATSHSVPRPSVASLFGVGVEICDSVVRWVKTRARPNASALAWPQRDEAECKCERARPCGCPEKYILAGGTSDPQGNVRECESRARGQKRGPGQSGEKMVEAGCEGLSQHIAAHAP